MTQNYLSIELPSKCKLYSNVDPEQIKVRAFTGGDEAILSEITERNALEKITEVLGRSLQGIDIKELSLGDKLYLMVWHAINSYSDGFSTSIVCEHCLMKSTIEYKLADADIVCLADDFKEPIERSLSDGSVVKCRLARVKDELQINRMARDLGNVHLHTIAVTIIDSQKDIVQKVNWLNDLSSKDIAKIRAIQDTYYHGPDFKMKYKCPKCAGEGTFIAPFRFVHFFPYGDVLTKNFGVEI